MASRKQNQPPVPERIFDKEGHVYVKGKFLGRGGFARCYEFIDQERRVFAGKAVAKCMLQKPGNREKVGFIVLQPTHMLTFHMLPCTTVEPRLFLYMYFPSRWYKKCRSIGY